MNVIIRYSFRKQYDVVHHDAILLFQMRTKLCPSTIGTMVSMTTTHFYAKYSFSLVQVMGWGIDLKYLAHLIHLDSPIRQLSQSGTDLDFCLSYLFVQSKKLQMTGTNKDRRDCYNLQNGITPDYTTWKQHLDDGKAFVSLPSCFHDGMDMNNILQ